MPLIERFCKPREYIGVDIEPGKTSMLCYQPRNSLIISDLSLLIL